MTLRHATQKKCFGAVDQTTHERQILAAFVLGMAINLLSIYLGNPYFVSLIMVPVAAIATLNWLYRPLPWIALVSVIAANPVNLNASISLNFVFVIFYVLLNMHDMNRLPSWLYTTMIFAGLSILGSTISWSETGNVFTQFAAVGNYVIGPLFLIPLTYFRLQEENNADLVLKVFVVSLIVPTFALLFLARIFGTPVIDANTNAFDYLVNISVYHLGNTDFYLTRTQSGIPLAALLSASFAVFVNPAVNSARIIAFVSFALGIFLLLVTGSVGSSLAALCGIGLILVIGQRYFSIKRYLIILLTIILLAIIGFNSAPQGIKEYAISRYDEKLSGGVDTSDRTELWEASLDYLTDNPLGHGWDLYVEPIGTYPHNDYLSYGIAFGFACGLVYLFVPVKILFSSVTAKLKPENSARVALSLATIGAVTVLLINSMSDHLTANRWYFNIVWSIIWFGYFASRSRVK